MSRLVAFLIGLTFTACLGCSQPATSQSASQNTIDQVCRITAELLGVDSANVRATTSLGDLGADQLDTIELILELEEYFDVTIPDEAINNVTGDEEWQTGIDRLTMVRLAEIVDRQKRRVRCSTTPTPKA
jgi:acyl carrier protein